MTSLYDTDTNAIRFLEDAGYELQKNFVWRKPVPDHEVTSEENQAIDYLFWEWDYGGLEGE